MIPGRRLLEEFRYDLLSRIPRCGLSALGRTVYSQNEEDGIIEEIFRRIGTTNKTFVEIGAGDGLENNTSALLVKGWKGLWIDRWWNCHKARRGCKDIIRRGKLRVVNARVTAENVDEIVRANCFDTSPDLLSIDIDGNDFWVWDALTIEPRVLVIEYNSRFSNWSQRYNPKHKWDGSCYQGSSLEFIANNLCGSYSLVGCNITGVNAFFVLDDYTGKFAGPGDVETHWRPLRAGLCGIDTGHPRSYKPINEAM